jgi:hypothetical protein
MPFPSAVREAGPALGSIYKSINASQAKTYRLDRLLFPDAKLTDTSQPCLRTDNVVSMMPSVLVNPLFPHASIAQREDLFHALAAYVETASMLIGGSESDASASLPDLQQSVTRLTASARVHLRNDLVISDEAANFAHSIDLLSTAKGNRTAAARAIQRASPTVDQLLSILQVDARKAHQVANNAAQDAYATWVAYGSHGRQPAQLSGRGQPMVRCTASFPEQAQAFLAAAAIATPRSTTVARLGDKTLSLSDPSAMIGALQVVHRSLLLFAQAPDDLRVSRELATAIQEFRSEVEQFSARARFSDATGFSHVLPGLQEVAAAERADVLKSAIGKARD